MKQLNLPKSVRRRIITQGIPNHFVIDNGDIDLIYFEPDNTFHLQHYRNNKISESFDNAANLLQAFDRKTLKWFN